MKQTIQNIIQALHTHHHFILAYILSKHLYISFAFYVQYVF